jgi:hypothetical protein
MTDNTLFVPELECYSICFGDKLRKGLGAQSWPQSGLCHVLPRQNCVITLIPAGIVSFTLVWIVPSSRQDPGHVPLSPVPHCATSEFVSNIPPGTQDLCHGLCPMLWILSSQSLCHFPAKTELYALAGIPTLSPRDLN